MQIFKIYDINQLQKSKSKPKQNSFESPYMQQYNICNNLKTNSNYMELKTKKRKQNTM